MPNCFIRFLPFFCFSSNLRLRETSANIIGSADVYVSDFGVHKAVLNRYMRDQAVLCLDPDHVGIAFLRPFSKTPLARTGDSERFQIIGEATLVVTNPNAHAKVQNVGG